MEFKALPGFRDFYPERMALRRHVEDAWHAAARASGFEEIEGPPLESLELLKAKSGDAIVEEIYAFVDKGGREVALRAEMTPTLARMVAAKAQALRKPMKWYGVPQLFRYQRKQRGRLREHIQWNVDIVGASEVGADADALFVALDALRRLGLTEEHVYVRVSHLPTLEQKLDGLGIEDKEGVRRKIDREDFDGLDGALRRWLKEPGEVAAACGDFLDACADLGVRDYIEIDPTIVRGLAYYTGIVWEIFDRGRKLRAVAGGGRYDTLIEKLGGPPMPALGFGMGDVVVGDLLGDLGLLPDPPPRVDVIVAPLAEEMIGAARRKVRALRAEGHHAEALYAVVKRNAAFKAAKAARARAMVLLHPDGTEESVEP